MLQLLKESKTGINISVLGGCIAAVALIIGIKPALLVLGTVAVSGVISNAINKKLGNTERKRIE